MTVTPDQAQILTTLVLAARPHGAPHWDASGVMAAVKKVADLSLPDVVRAAMNAAEDRTLITPGAIGNPTAPCWRAIPAPPAASRNTWPEDLRDQCAECLKARADCEAAKHSGHEFVSVLEHQQKREATRADVRAAVAGVKQLAASSQPTTTGGSP